MRILLALCTTLAASPLLAATIPDGQWREATSSAEQPLSFTSRSGQLAGFAGCNRFRWHALGSAARPLSTRMLCAPETMHREQQFLELLASHPQVETSPGKLALFNGDRRYQFVDVSNSTATPASVSFNLLVDAHSVPCSGVGPMQCLRIRPDGSNDWQLLYNGIDGFTPTPGSSYYLQVRREVLANPPADAPAERLVLVRELYRETVVLQR